MDAFEQLAAEIFRGRGYWVRSGFKVELTRDDKQRIGSPSCPRWELDLIAFRPVARELLVHECKSYLDSGGVHAAHFTPERAWPVATSCSTRPACARRSSIGYGIS